jgi:hypothetical protein
MASATHCLALKQGIRIETSGRTLSRNRHWLDQLKSPDDFESAGNFFYQLKLFDQFGVHPSSEAIWYGRLL